MPLLASPARMLTVPCTVCGDPNGSASSGRTDTRTATSRLVRWLNCTSYSTTAPRPGRCPSGSRLKWKNISLASGCTGLMKPKDSFRVTTTPVSRPGGHTACPAGLAGGGASASGLPALQSRSVRGGSAIAVTRSPTARRCRLRRCTATRHSTALPARGTAPSATSASSNSSVSPGAALGPAAEASVGCPSATPVTRSTPMAPSRRAVACASWVTTAVSTCSPSSCVWMVPAGRIFTALALGLSLRGLGTMVNSTSVPSETRSRMW
mmetsp:Transcript_35534/g.89203  ORF Transcript_35534/g.89203 Transcript_35534/m.89203 type:complete len:266 (+) Transcript_35534:1820-2617(+)